MKHILASLITSLILVGCSLTNEPVLNSTPVDIDGGDLKQYWIAKVSKYSFNTKRRKMPDEGGEVTVRFLIDSTGTVLQQEVVESTNGQWNDIALRALDNHAYTPAESNPQSTPVYTTTVFTFGG